MSKVVDERVVSMQFDNDRFERNANTSLSTINKLKQGLKFEGASKNLDAVSESVKNVKFDGMGRALETVNAKFSAMQIVGVTALANITNSAINTGKRMVKALTIDPIKSGFQEYEIKMNAIQTIMSNTSNKGKTMSDITRVLEELNIYADKTIYNFSEMTRNIGTFTAAGVDLEKSAASIQGIANLAASSGSTSQQASVAMYQLSQAIASGTVKLMDWNSVVNAGMGGQKFQEALKDTAREHGVAVDAMIKDSGSFRESLQKGWITAEILTTTLDKFTVKGAKKYAKSMMESGKWTQKQADALIKESRAMEDAATKVKTFTQLWDTLKETAQSGWGMSWEIIIGDFNEAKKSLTKVSSVIGGMLDESSNARNNMLKGWKSRGGRDDLLSSVSNSFKGLMSVIKPVTSAFREVFPRTTSEQLYTITKGIKKFTESLTLSDKHSKQLHETFKGFYSILDMVRKAVASLIIPLSKFMVGGFMSSILDVVLSVTSAFGRFFSALNGSLEVGNAFSVIGDVVTFSLQSISNAITSVIHLFGKFGDVASFVGESLGSTISNIATWVKSNISASDIFAGLAGSGIFVVAKNLSSLIGKITSVIENFSISNFLFGATAESINEGVGAFTDMLGQINEALRVFTQGIKVASLVGVALAVTMLVNAIDKLSTLSAESVVFSLGAIKIMIVMLNSGFRDLVKTLTTFKPSGALKASIALIAMATAINIMATAMAKIQKLSWDQMLRGIMTLSVSIKLLTKSVGAIADKGVTLKTSISLLALAKSCEMLSTSLVALSKMSFSGIARGLVAMAGSLGILIGSVVALDKFTSGKSIIAAGSILIMTESLQNIVGPLKELGTMSWSKIARGLTAMGGALLEVGVVAGVLGRLAGVSSIFGAATIKMVSSGLSNISGAFKSIAEMSWTGVKKSLTAMGGALLEIGVVAGVLGKFAGISSLFAASSITTVTKGLSNIANALGKLGMMTWGEIKKSITALGESLVLIGGVAGILGKIGGISSILGAEAVLTVSKSLENISAALTKIGDMSWKNIKKGLIGLGVSLAEIGTVVGVLGSFAGFSGIIGSVSIGLLTESLGTICDALDKLGQMSWSSIKKGLAAMGGTLAELGIVAGATGGIAGFAGLVGAGTILLASQGLDTIASAFEKFGDMTWDKVKIGITAMGGALTALAVGSLANTLSIIGAGTISVAAEPLLILAESLQKFGSMSWDQVETGILAMTTVLSTIASGSLMNTLSILGSFSLKTVAEPLGKLADSVKKWNGLEVSDKLGDNLAGLARGVRKFTTSGLGAAGIYILTGPLGSLAKSVKKWAGVTVPETIESGLTKLATGVKAFSFAFLGSWSISVLAESLGTLGDSISKWKNITVPEDFDTQLKSISEGISTFGLMDAIALLAIAGPMNKLASALNTLGSVKVGSNLPKLASNIKESINNLSQIGTATVVNVSSMITKLANAFGKISKTDVSNVGAFVKAANKLNDIKIDKVSVDSNGLKSGVTAIQTTMGSISTTIKESKTSVSSAMKTAVSGISSAISSKSNSTVNAGKALIASLITGIESKTNEVKKVCTTLTTRARNAISEKNSSFKSAGINLGEGLILGIESKMNAVYWAAYKLGQKAVEGEKDGQQSKSPSKLTFQSGVWFGEGLINGIKSTTSKVYEAGYGIGNKAVDSLSSAISTIPDILNGDFGFQPTIKPVVDLSDVRAGADLASSILDITSPSIALDILGPAGRLINRRIQNGTNTEVVTAIEKLRSELGNVGGSSYYIDGVTYDDGSNVSDAVQTLVRAAKIERRV